MFNLGFSLYVCITAGLSLPAVFLFGGRGGEGGQLGYLSCPDRITGSWSLFDGLPSKFCPYTSSLKSLFFFVFFGDFPLAFYLSQSDFCVCCFLYLQLICMVFSLYAPQPHALILRWNSQTEVAVTATFFGLNPDICQKWVWHLPKINQHPLASEKLLNRIIY